MQSPGVMGGQNGDVELVIFYEEHGQILKTSTRAPKSETALP